MSHRRKAKQQARARVKKARQLQRYDKNDFYYLQLDTSHWFFAENSYPLPPVIRRRS